MLVTVKVIKVKGRREIKVFDAATGSLRFAVYPFGKSYRGTFQVKERDVIAGRPLGRIRHRPRSRGVKQPFPGWRGDVPPAQLPALPRVRQPPHPESRDDPLPRRRFPAVRAIPGAVPSLPAAVPGAVRAVGPSPSAHLQPQHPVDNYGRPLSPVPVGCRP